MLRFSFFESKLNPPQRPLASHGVVCAFVGDKLDAETIKPCPQEA